MLRLIAVFLASISVCVAAENPEMAALLARLEPLRNVFAEPVVNEQRAGAETIYAVLNNVVSAVFGSNGSGCVLLDGIPWRTGETRLIRTGGNATKVLLVSVRAAGDDRPGGAEFTLIENNQNISVDLRGIEAPLEVVQDPAGWLLASRLVVTTEKVGDGRVRIRVGGAEIIGRPVARSTNAGLNLIQLDHEGGANPLIADPAYVGRAIIVPLHREPMRVPSAVLIQPPTRDYLVGAMATTEDGKLLGIIGKQGLVRPAELGIEGAADGEPLTATFSRRVTYQSEIALK